VDAATRAYLDQVPLDKKLASNAYFEGGYWLYLWGFLYGAAIMVLLLTSGISARLRDFATRLTGRRNLQTAVYFVGFLLLVALLQFPLTLYQDFVREQHYGLATQTFSSWMRDVLVNIAVNLVLDTLAIVALFAIVRRLGRSWWIWGAAAAVIFIAIGLIIAPVFIFPLFNKYTRLENGPVRDAVLSMARANGIPARDVYVMDASRQTTRISANVSGFLGTERVTLNDNLLKRCSLAEIKAAMGHEMGHYILNHNYKMLLFFAVLHGERIRAVPTAGATLALAYLIVAGSIVGYSAYQYLLSRVRPTLAASYAYVNPVVAVGLGAAVAGESVAPRALGALALILGGVAMLAIRRQSA